MEAKLYRELYQLVFSTAHPPRRAREQFCDRWIVMMYFWSTLHDRPACWASDPDHWPDRLARPLASQSRLSRRLRTPSVIGLIERLLLSVSDRFGIPLVKLIDSKPLTVGPYTKDKDATRGRSRVWARCRRGSAAPIAWHCGRPPKSCSTSGDWRKMKDLWRRRIRLIPVCG